MSQYNSGMHPCTRTLAGIFTVVLGVATGLPAAAGDFEVGEVRGTLDTTVSAGVGIRVAERNCDLIFAGNGGCNPNFAFTNADDGNLNYDKGDVYSNRYKGIFDLELNWRNYGAFFRGTLFYDLVGQEIDPRRTDLARDARYRDSALESGVVGMGYQLLDAYVQGSWEVRNRLIDLRVGNQAVNWGEGLFIPGGINSILALDVAKLRSPGSELREGFLPSPVVKVSAEIFRNLSVEAYYQFGWFKTQLDPTGYYFSTSDLVGRGAQGFFFGPDPGARGQDAEEVFQELGIPNPAGVVGPPPDPVITSVQASDIPPEQIPPGFTPELLELIFDVFRSQGYDFNTISTIPGFFPAGIPQLDDDAARSQGQWGAAIRYFIEPIQTELALYYARFHDKTPSVGFTARPYDLVIDTFVLPETWPPLFLSGFPPEVLPPNPLETTVQPLSIPVGYFREYVEDIDIFAGSFATEIYGIAFAGEISYRPRSPVPVVTALPEALDLALATGDQVRVSGFTRENRLQAQVSAIATLGPGDPFFGSLVRCLHISSMSFTTEFGVVHYPGLSSAPIYVGPGFTTDVDDTSWGYTMRIQGDYDNPLGVPITVTPRISFSHDVSGNTPGLTPFIDSRKAVNVGATVDYLKVWQFDVGYTNFFGAGVSNDLNDRDFVSVSLTRSF
jgi:hypothetical protein